MVQRYTDDFVLSIGPIQETVAGNRVKIFLYIRNPRTASEESIFYRIRVQSEFFPSSIPSSGLLTRKEKDQVLDSLRIGEDLCVVSQGYLL